MKTHNDVSDRADQENDVRAMIAMIEYLAQSAEELNPPADAVSDALHEALKAAQVYQAESAARGSELQ